MPDNNGYKAYFPYAKEDGDAALVRDRSEYNPSDASSASYNQAPLYGAGVADKKTVYGTTTTPTDPALADYHGLTYGSRIALQEEYDYRTQLIRGTMAFSKEKLRELDPSYTGYSHIFVLRLPPFMVNVADGYYIEGYDSQSTYNNIQKKNEKTLSAGYYNMQKMAQNSCNAFKTLIEMGSTSYNGTPELTLNMTEVNTGFSERSYPAPTYAAYDGKNFTIRCLETRGEPLRRAAEFYINGVSDANLKATTMYGAIDRSGAAKLLEPTLSNYTFTIMVVQTDQTLLRIQDISLWNSCVLTGIQRSQLDWDNGTIDIVQPLDLQFNGVYMPDTHNAYLDDLALKLLAQRMRFYKRYTEMDKIDLGADAWEGGNIRYGDHSR